MSSTQLEQLRQMLKEKSTTTAPNRNQTGDNALYRFWNAQMGETATLRFLGDGTGEDNLFFWVERRVINLPFDGIAGRADHAGKEVTVQVPCMKMYGRENRCPILEETSKYWKTELEPLARVYWPKRTYLMQGFVRQHPAWIPGREDNPPENPIRRFNINQSLFKNIEEQIKDPDMASMPNDYNNGTDFRIIKSQHGQHANYQTSSFARRESPLTDEELLAIENFGLFNLRDYLPKRPNEDGLAVIEEMFRASLEGLPYDPKWADFYRPFGVNFDTPSTNQSTVPSNYQANSTPETTPQQTTQQAAPQPEPQPEPTKSEESAGSDSASPNDALARLRAEVQKSSSR